MTMYKSAQIIRRKGRAEQALNGVMGLETLLVQSVSR